MKHHLQAGALALLLGVTTLIAYIAGGKPATWAVATGGLVPALISWISMVLIVDLSADALGSRHMQTMLVNFYAKVLVYGVWISIILASTDLPKEVFSLSLVANFLLWHFLEAWTYQEHLLGKRQLIVAASTGRP